ncbi:unnamed protein product [Closterium sp. NIES-65]|nr:unnamed protein product [Closterium sp. NIES-65]
MLCIIPSHPLPSSPSARLLACSYGRFEVLSGFVNAVFLVLIAALIVFESIESQTNSLIISEPALELAFERALEPQSCLPFCLDPGFFTLLPSSCCPFSLPLSRSRILDPPDISTANLLAVSVGGLVVNMALRSFLLPTCCFVSSSHNRSCSPSIPLLLLPSTHSRILPTHRLLAGIFLHVLADTLGSVGVVISTLLIKYKGWMLTDPIETMAGVVAVRQRHFWSFTPKMLVGSIHVLISPDSLKNRAKEGAAAAHNGDAYSDFLTPTSLPLSLSLSLPLIPSLPPPLTQSNPSRNSSLARHPRPPSHVCLTRFHLSLLTRLHTPTPHSPSRTPAGTPAPPGSQERGLPALQHYQHHPPS